MTALFEVLVGWLVGLSVIIPMLLSEHLFANNHDISLFPAGGGGGEPLL